MFLLYKLILIAPSGKLGAIYANAVKLTSLF